MADRASPLNAKKPSRSRAIDVSPFKVSIGGAMLALILLVFEPAWFGWFLIEPLPNAGTVGVGQKIRRWMFLGRAIPEVIPEIGFHESYLGLAIDELSHVETLPQRIPLVLAAGLIGFGAIGLGGLVLRGMGLSRSLSTAERLALSFGVGASALGVVTLILGRLGALGPWPVRIGLGLLGLVELTWAARDGWRRGAKPAWPRGLAPWLGFLAITGPFLLLMILGAMLPTIDFDAIEYHLQGPKEYFQSGRISFLPHNVYTSMPFNVEMLHLLGMEVMGDWWSGALVGQLLIAAHAPMAAALIALTASRWGSPRAGWMAAVVYLTTPWIYRLGVLPYVEGPLCDFHAALFYAGALAWLEADPRLRKRFWLLAGWLAGAAMACKYTALISAVVPFGLAALVDSARRRSPANLIAFGFGWLIVMAPWLVKNVIDTGNPVYPLGFKVFGGRYWDTAMEQKWANVHGPRPISLGLLWTSIVDVAGRSDWQSSLYVALAPLAFSSAKWRRFAIVLVGYVFYIFLTWWFFTHRLDRFWLPLLPSLAVLAGLGADWSRRWLWTIPLGLLMTLAIITNLAYSSTALTALNEWTGDLQELRKSVPRRLNKSLAQLDAQLPPDAKILMVGQAAVFHVEHRIVYNTVFDDETFETLTRDKTPAQVSEALRNLGITHVYVDWFEIERYRSPGNYGFTSYVTPEVFEKLANAGVLHPAEAMAEKRELYKVRLARG